MAGVKDEDRIQTLVLPMVMGGKGHIQQQQQQQHSLFSQASWGRLEMKPERNKFKVQAH